MSVLCSSESTIEVLNSGFETLSSDNILLMQNENASSNFTSNQSTANLVPTEVRLSRKRFQI
jgi:hypothetical protein